MEGKGRSRRRSPHQQWKRRLSSVLAIVLTAVMVLNMPLSIDGLGLHVSNAFASASNADRKDSVWATASNAKYKQGESQDVDIYVIADDNGAVPGNTSSMTLYLKNNTNQMITEGVLTFKGSHIQKEDGVFQDIGAGDEASQVIVSGPGQDAGTTPESGAAADDGAAANEGAAVNDGAPQAADVSGNDAAQGTGLAQDTVTSGEGLLYEESFDADEAGEDSDFAEDFEGDEEDSEEEETWKLTGIDLQPGEMHEVSFAFYTDEDVKSTKAHVKFSFAGEDEEGERVSSDTQFYYSIGLPHVNISLEDGMQIESNVNNDMEIWMTEPDWVDEDLEERIEDQEEKEAEKEQEEDADNSGSSDTASDSNASKSDADRADTASDSQADREEKPSVIRDEEKIDKYTDEAMTISESRVSYTVEIFGAEYDLHARKADEVEDIGWISCVYKIAKETQPGIYYGKVTAAGRWNNKKFTSEQGFLFEVTGEWDGNYTAKSENVTVHAHAEDGVLPKNVTLKVTELEEGGAEYNKAKEAMDGTDIQLDGMKALDIRFENQNGEEVEPEGEVQISIEMKEGALPADAALDTVEVHHLKEVDNETIEVETVADAAGLTDGTVKSGEAVQAELEEIAADAEEETEASADVYTQAAIPAAVAAPVTLDAVAEVDKDTVAVAEFSVESFSSFTITWWKLPEPSISNQKNTVNFYVNLFSRIANSSEDGGSSAKTENFTLSVQETYLNSHPNEFYYTTDPGDEGAYIVIQGSTDGSAYEIDKTIRTLEDGYKDASVSDLWGERKPFKIADFPTDQEVFNTIKSDWDTYTKDQGIKINNVEISPEDLTTDNYSIRWYVFKYNKTDAWHVDGILVPRYGRLTVEKTFAGQDPGSIVASLKDDFAILVEGQVGNIEQSYKLILSDKDESQSIRGYDSVKEENDQITYTWNVDVLETTYTIKEENYSSNTWGCISAKYSKIVDSESSDQDVSNAVYTGNVTIECVKTANDEASPDEQKVSLINTYEKKTNDLTINKEVTGITEDQVSNQTFTFEVKATGQTALLIPGQDYNIINGSDSTKVSVNQQNALEVQILGANSVTIKDLPIGTYVVTEKTDEIFDLPAAYYVSNDGPQNVTLKKETAGNVTITNNYEPWLTLTVKKVVGGNMGDISASETYPFEVSIVRNGKDVTSVVMESSGTFTLSHNGEKQIGGLKKGDVITVQETDSKGYEVYINVDNGTPSKGDTYTTEIDGLQGSTVVEFTNKRDVITPTGIFTENYPYILMLAIAAVGATSFIYPTCRRRRHKGDR